MCATSKIQFLHVDVDINQFLRIKEKSSKRMQFWHGWSCWALEWKRTIQRCCFHANARETQLWQGMHESLDCLRLCDYTGCIHLRENMANCWVFTFRRTSSFLSLGPTSFVVLGFGVSIITESKTIQTFVASLVKVVFLLHIHGNNNIIGLSSFTLELNNLNHVSSNFYFLILSCLFFLWYAFK